MFSVDVSFFFSPPVAKEAGASLGVSDVTYTSHASCFYYMSPLPSGLTPPTAFFFFLKIIYIIKGEIHNSTYIFFMFKNVQPRLCNAVEVTASA